MTVALQTEVNGRELTVETDGDTKAELQHRVKNILHKMGIRKKLVWHPLWVSGHTKS